MYTIIYNLLYNHVYIALFIDAFMTVWKIHSLIISQLTLFRVLTWDLLHTKYVTLMTLKVHSVRIHE